MIKRLNLFEQCMERKCVKVATAYTCVTYTESFVEKNILAYVFELHMPHCESIVKNIDDASESFEIYPLTWRQRTKVYAGSRRYKLRIVILFRIC